ncbi:MAG: ATP-dependent metallopeptidase FtsH/Yme1/Tma family protein [Burkholderiales bacterium]|nr:ATP-dependent metallopeptidase FtsH/Yme1/Tma family protein [Anaerolineae bacterium]
MRFPIQPKKDSDKDKQGSKRPGSPNGGPNNNRPGFQLPRWTWLALWLLFLAWSFSRLPGMLSEVSSSGPIEIPYSVFREQVEANNVSEVTLQDQQAQGEFREALSYPPAQGDQAAGTPSTNFITTLLPVNVTDDELVSLLNENNVTVVAETYEANPILLFLINFGPILLLLGFFIWSTRRAQRQMGGVFGFGRTQAREHNAEKPQITFGDVAGQEPAKNELVEIVDFLREPDKYIALGARIPRGVLLVGPPGTGKTLLARAVAGEANVAFFSIAASEFVEMFVGVGASRVRDLFGKAKAAAPSIVFIDEIDAVGRQRGAGLGGGHDEREQTLNQMLAEMDGFEQNESVIVMAATNRPDVLDPALLRPGRFDRQVTVGMPDRSGRLSILKIHARGKPLSTDVDLEQLSKATIGFSGADLANLANEAALTAARKNHKKLSMRDFQDAFDRIVLGLESPPLSNEQERRLVAYHEAGHAVVAALLPEFDPVFKVTIMPRGQALGVTAVIPEEDRRNLTRTYLIHRMMMGLGGRTAEEMVFEEITTGAESDLRMVTSLAHRMVAQFGMSETIGPLNFGDDERQPFLGYSLGQNRNYSEETASKIDAEVKRIIENAHQQTRALLEQHRDKLDALAQELLDTEIVDAARVLEIVGISAEKAEQLGIPALVVPEVSVQHTAPESDTLHDLLETPSSAPKSNGSHESDETQTESQQQ